jgi:hypothetical protein
MAAVSITKSQNNLELRSKEAAGETSGDVVASVFGNLLGLILVLCAVNVFEVFDLTTASILLPIAMVVGCGWSAYRLLRRRPITLLTTYPWLLLAIGVFHGIGSLAPVLANRDTRAYMNGSFVVTPEWLARTNTLNLVGLSAISGGILFGNALRDRSQPSGRRQAIRQVEPAVAARLATIALGIGLPVLLGLRLPAQFGWLPFIVPGSMLQLASFVQVSFIILAYLYEKRWRGAGLTLAFLLPLIMLAEIVTFAKETALLVVITPFIGSYLAIRKMSRLVLGAATCIAFYVILVPVVTDARMQVAARQQTEVGEQGVSLEERIAILQSSIEKKWLYRGLRIETQDRQQIWWARLSYNNVQAYVMKEFDQGRPGNPLRDAFATLIPRFLWPDKPIISKIGVDFYQQFSGFRGAKGTSFGVGAFGEGYWMGGWWGVIFIAFAVGLELAVMSNLVFRHEREGNVIAFILCFLYGIATARSIDKWIVMSYIGNLPIYISLYFLSLLALRHTAKHSVTKGAINR